MQYPNQLFNYFFCFILFLVSCKQSNQELITNVPVNITIFPSNPQYIKLNAINGWQYINGGVSGIIVYRKDLNEFMAYERLSPYLPLSKPCIIKVDQSNNVVIEDSCSGSKFLITDGSVIQGPANQSLKKYATLWDGNTLSITNF